MLPFLSALWGKYYLWGMLCICQAQTQLQLQLKLRLVLFLNSFSKAPTPTPTQCILMLCRLQPNCILLHCICRSNHSFQLLIKLLSSCVFLIFDLVTYLSVHWSIISWSTFWSVYYILISWQKNRFVRLTFDLLIYVLILWSTFWSVDFSSVDLAFATLSLIKNCLTWYQ